MITTDAPGSETDPFSDVFNPSGNVTFAISQMSTVIEIITVDDEVNFFISNHFGGGRWVVDRGRGSGG